MGHVTEIVARSSSRGEFSSSREAILRIRLRRTVWDAEKPRQIWDTDQFRKRKRGDTGVIVIFDRVRDAPIAHVPACRHVTEERFRQKMLEMGGKNGRYWWFERFSDAEGRLGARRCGHCG